MRIYPGKPYPLGATWDGAGVNFALFSENATAVDLCLFNGPDQRHETRVRIKEETDQVRHIYLPEVRPGQTYGYRVDGPTLLLSQGVPMIQGGDEICRTSQGNNNTYCQDNELSWIDWDLDRDKKDMLEFTRFVIGLTKLHPVLRRRKFFQGRSIRGSEVKDLTWLKPEGQEMTDEDWSNPFARCIGLRLVGDAMDELDDKGRFVRDGTLLLLINAHYEKIPLVLPIDEPDAAWGLILDTREPTGKRLRYQPTPAGESYELEDRSLAFFYLSRME